MHNIKEQRSAIEAEVMQDILSDPELVWETLGPDGITYPGLNTNTLRMDKGQREHCHLKMRAIDDSIAIHLGMLIVLKDYEAIGRIMVLQAEACLADRVEAGINEIERDYELTYDKNKHW